VIPKTADSCFQVTQPVCVHLANLPWFCQTSMLLVSPLGGVLGVCIWWNKGRRLVLWLLKVGDKFKIGYKPTPIFKHNYYNAGGVLFL
jgi:hypothetical protein